MRAENHLPIMLKSASSKAITPTANANWVTSSEFLGMTPSSINRLNKSGVAMISRASITTVIRKSESEILYGIAKLAMRFKVPGLSFWFLTEES